MAPPVSAPRLLYRVAVAEEWRLFTETEAVTVVLVAEQAAITQPQMTQAVQ